MKALAAGLVACALLMACGASQESQDKLRETVVRFNEGVRWGRLQDVMPYVYAENSAHFLEMHKAFGKDIQVSDYEIITVTLDSEKKKADVNVQISWYRLSQMVSYTTILVQHWEKQKQDWIMIAEEFRSGEPF